MPADRLGPYAIEGRLATGSLGPVWHSKDPESGKDVVVRVVESPDRRRPGAWPRLVEALPSLRCLEHPGLSRILGVVEDGGTKAIVEEFVGGQDLGEMLREAGGRLAPEALYPLISDVLAALEHARQFDVAHLRINPRTIRVHRTNRVRARVVGFGLGRTWGPAVSVDDVAVQDAPYLAPEQWHPLLPVGHATDVYAVGAVMYEALTGRPPFPGDTTRAISERHLAGALLPPGDLRPDLPWFLSDTVLAALVRHPSDRLPHAGALRIPVEGARRGAVIRPRTKRPTNVLEDVDHAGDTRPSPAVRTFEYGLSADTEEHALFGGITAASAMRPGKPRLADRERVEDTRLINTLALPPQPDDSADGLPFKDTALRGSGRGAGGPHDLATARTLAAQVPKDLLGVDLGPPIGPSDPVQEAADLADDATGQFEVGATEALDVPLSVRQVDLDAATEKARAPTPPTGRALRAAPPPSPDDIGNAPTAAVEIPKFMRGVSLDDD